MTLLKLRSLLILCILSLLLCTQTAMAQAVPIKIVIYGDSITAGYQLDKNASFPTMLERKLQSDGYHVEVINMSVPAENSSGGLKRIKDVLLHHPDIVLVQLGINDAFRGVDVGKVIYPNLNKIVGILMKQNIGVLICGMKGPPNMKKSYNKVFEAMYYSLARHHRTSYYDDMLKGVTGRSDLTLADGLHPNEKGTLAMVQNIYPSVLRLVKWRQKYLEYKANAE